MELAVGMTLTRPNELDAIDAPDGNVAEARFAGPVNVTVTPGTTFPNASLTFAISGNPNGTLTMAVWPVPKTALIFDTDPGLFVRVNVDGTATPATEKLML